MIHVQKVTALNVAPYKRQMRGPAVSVTILAYTYLASRLHLEQPCSCATDTMPDPDIQPGAGLTCWLLDTRSLWPGKKITDSESVCYPCQLQDGSGLLTCDTRPEKHYNLSHLKNEKTYVENTTSPTLA
jgi:hypothetical protein